MRHAPHRLWSERQGGEPLSGHCGLTLLETVIALAIMAVVFAVLLPTFRNLQNSWASRQGGAEALQNGRILTDHLHRNISKAVRITSVSAAAQNLGHIQFDATDGITYRYELSNDNRVMFGPVGQLAELAAPVSLLQFTCYDALDLDTPITQANLIRVVRARTVLVNAAETGLDKPFETLVYLRSNTPGAGEGLIAGPPSSFGITTGNAPVVARIDPAHYLCAFTGPNNHGWAVVLTVNTAAQTVARETPFRFDGKNGVNASLAQIDETRFLCAYEGPKGEGYAVILRVNPANWSIESGASYKFDIKVGKPVLDRIDATHFLCVYQGGSQANGFAKVFRVDPALMTVNSGASLTYDARRGANPTLRRLDAARFICAYQGWSSFIWAVVLTVNTSNLTVSAHTECNLMLGYGDSPALAQIDATRFLCVYSGNASDGMAVVLTVHPESWTVTRSQPFQYDLPLGNIPSVMRIGRSMRYLCTYQGYMSKLWGIVLEVDPLTWNIRGEHKTPLSPWKALKPDLATVDENNYLCVHEDQINKGWALLIKVGGDSIRP